MYDLFIGNKNYSSWSLRPWVLMRELNIPFRENLVPFGGAQNPDASAASRPPARCPAWSTATSRCGIRWPSPSTWASGMRACGRPRPRRAPGRAPPAPRCTRVSLRLRNACTMNCGIRVTLKSIEPAARARSRPARGAVGRWHRPFRRAVPHRRPLLRRRRVLRAGGFSHPDLRPAAQRRRAPLCRAAAGIALHEGLVRGGAAGNLARRRARDRRARHG